MMKKQKKIEIEIEIEKEEEPTMHCPEDRIKMSNEMAMQKAEKERHEQANQPKLKGEKEFEEDQRTTIEKARESEERGNIKQCNDGKKVFECTYILYTYIYTTIHIHICF